MEPAEGADGRNNEKVAEITISEGSTIPANDLRQYLPPHPAPTSSLPIANTALTAGILRGMRFSLSNCVALGTKDMNGAADYYEKVLGYERGKSSDSWIELSSGALKIFVCNDDIVHPVFDLQVDDIDAAEKYLSENGFTKAVLSEDDKELFMKDPFGYIYCISERVTGE